MRFLADENIPRAAVEALRSAGHEVLWACESSPGAPDMELLRTANQDGLIILTLDKDFGELARASGVSRDAGVVLFRMLCQTRAKRLALSQKCWEAGKIGWDTFPSSPRAPSG